MTTKKRLILNLFEMNCVSHITHGLWRLPDNNRERHNDIEYWIELAGRLETGYPHLEEAYRFGEGVLPELAGRGLWQHPAPTRRTTAAISFGGDLLTGAPS